MKVCQHCGAHARLETQKFCAQCGRPFDEVTFEENKAPVRVLVPKQTQETISELEHTAAPVQQNGVAQKLKFPTSGVPAAPVQRRNSRPKIEPPAEASFPPKIPEASDQPKIPSPVSVPEQPCTSSVPEDISTSFHDEAQSTLAESFFEPEPAPDIPADFLQDVSGASTGTILEEQSSTPKKRFPKAILVLLVLVLATALFGGGFFIWQKIEQNKNVTIGGISYNIQDTTSLSIESPSDEDWLNLCKLSNLTSLTLMGNTALDAGKLNDLSALQLLTELSIDSAIFSDGLSSLPALPMLETLSLTNCQLTSSQCDGASLPVSLHKLCLSGNELTNISFLQNCGQLEELFLDGNQIADYTPISGLTDLTTLSIDQCQVQAVNSLPVLKKLLVNGQEIKEPAAYLAELGSMTESYQNIISLFEAGDFNALTTVLQQLETAGSLDENVLTYANGWLMTNSSEWDIIRASLPSGSQVLVSDGNGLYYGQMNNGKRFGNGIQLFAVNHSIYSGSWNNDLPNGIGTYRKTTADGTVLELAGNYTDGYENGTMTFTATSDSGTQSGSYTAVNGTRATVEQISDNQVAFIRFDTIYWYDAFPDDHGVAIASIPYQEERFIQILPKAEPAPASSNSKNSSGNKNSSGSESTSPSAPQPSAPTESSSSASSSTADSSNPWNMTPEDALKKIQDGVQTASDIYHSAKEIYDMFN